MSRRSPLTAPLTPPHVKAHHHACPSTNVARNWKLEIKKQVVIGVEQISHKTSSLLHEGDAGSV